MKRASTIAAIALAFAASLVVAPPASAHTPNPYSSWSCGITRDHEEDVLVDAHPEAMGVYANGVSWLRSSCLTHSQGTSCNWVAESRSNGVHFVFPFGSDHNCT